MLKVIPMTDEHVVNKMSCFKNEGEEDAPVKPQSILPDLEGFELKGVEMTDDFSTTKFHSDFLKQAMTS